MSKQLYNELLNLQDISFSLSYNERFSKLKKLLICFQERLGLEGDILTDSLHPMVRTGRKSKSPEKAGKEAGADLLYLLPQAEAEAGYEAETDPLLECEVIVKEETEAEQDISIKSEPAD